MRFRSGRVSWLIVAVSLRSAGQLRGTWLRGVLILAVVVATLPVLAQSGLSAAAVMQPVVRAAQDAPAPCQCAGAVGPFVVPAAGSVVSGKQTSSGAYTATWSNGNVSVSKNGSPVLTTQGTIGGFGPGGKAFVAETLTESTTSVDVYNLSSTTPGTPVFHTGAPVTSGEMVFSPSGHYFLYSWTTSDGATHFQLADATATGEQPALWTQQVTSVSPPDTGLVTVGTIGTVRYGWGPDDSRFLYGATAANDEASWYWTDVSVAPQVTRSDLNIVATSSYVEYSPCGNGLAVVASSGTDTVTVNLFDSSTGETMGPQASGQTSAPVGLNATASSFVATIGGTDQTLASNTCTTTTTGGGGGGGGQTGGFVKPAAGSMVSGRQPSSGAYTATWSDGNVSVSKNGSPVLTTQGTVGGFAPGGKAFVAETLNTTSGVTSIRLFNLGAATPSTAVWNGGATVGTDQLVFSPKGQYLLYAYTTTSGNTASVNFEAADATAPSEQSAVWTSNPFVAGGVPTGEDGGGNFGPAAYGFGPDDSAFIYGYVSGQDVNWDWTDLAASPTATYSQPDVPASSSYLEFCPCGDSLATVDGSGTDTVNVNLFDSNSQQNLGSASGQANGAVTLSATTASFVATFNGTDHVLAPNTCTTGGGGGGGGAVHASFTVPTGLIAGQLGAFTDTSTDGGGTITAWSWDFGDGSSTSTDQNPTHRYLDPAAATYTVTLTAEDSGGGADVATQQVSVAADSPPVAAFTYQPDPATRGGQLSLTSTSTDPDGPDDIVATHWDTSAGSFDGTPVSIEDACPPMSVTLTVTDHAGLTDTVTQTIPVPAGARVINVPAGDSLADAVAHSCPGDTIDLAAGTYTGGVVLDGVNLEGAGMGSSIVDGPADGEVLTVESERSTDPITISDLSVRGGTVGIELETGENALDPTQIKRVEVDHNTAGGGISAADSVTGVDIDGASIHDNHNDGGAEGSGGGYTQFCCGHVTITNSDIYANSSSGDGGGAYPQENDGLVFTGNDVHDNTALGAGGGLYIDDGFGADDVVVDNRFTTNTATDGGGVDSNDWSTLFGGNLVAHNTGGGVEYGAPVNVVNDTIVDNTGTGLYQSTDPNGEGLSLANTILGGNTIDVPTDTVVCNVTHNMIGTLPAFADSSYRLAPGSAAVDAGANGVVPSELAVDADGQARIQDGDGDGTATVDIGYAELAGSGGHGGSADTVPTGCDPTLDQEGSGTLAAAASVATDSGNPPSVAVPLETNVTAPATPDGQRDDVSISEHKHVFAPGSDLQQWSVDIGAQPPEAADAPYSVVFSFDASLVGAVSAGELAVDEGGTAVPDCTGATGSADPDPCIASSIVLPSGEAQVTVLASAPGAGWTFDEPPVGRGDTYQVGGPTLAVAAPGVLGNDPAGALVDRVVAQPANGTLVGPAADGSFTYTPDAGFFGTDSFTYTIDLGGTQSPPISVTLQVLGSGSGPTLYVNAAWVGSASGSDPDGAGPATSFGTDAFSTLTDALTAAPTGALVLVAAGTYDEDLPAVEADGVRVIGAGPDSTHIDVDRSLAIDGTADVVADLDIEGPGTWDDATTSLTGSDDYLVQMYGTGSTVEDCRLALGYAGVYAEGDGAAGPAGNLYTIRNNTIEHVVEGIELDGVAGSTVIGNTIDDTSANPDDYGVGVLIDDGNAVQPQPGNLVKGNAIAKVGDVGIDVETSGNTINSNTITGTGTDPTDLEPDGIYLSDDSGEPVSHTTITGNTITGSAYAGVALDSGVATTTIDSNTITGTGDGGTDGFPDSGGTNSGGSAIQIAQYGTTGTTITHNALTGNTGWGVLQTDSSGKSAGTTVHNNDISGNALGGVENRDDTDNLDATQNWWGKPSGPAGAGPGAGDTVSSNVTFDPWLSCTFESTPCPVTNHPPTAAFTESADDLTLSVDGSGSSDPDGTVASYTWDFGDHTTGNGETAEHTYASAGTFTVTLTVTDDGGATGTTSQQITVTGATGSGGGTGGGGAPPPPPTTDAGTSSSSTGTAVATVVDGSGDQLVAAAATGVGTVTVATYPADPASPATFTASGTFVDVRVSPANSFIAVSISICQLNGGTGLEWYDSVAGGWRPVVAAGSPIDSNGCLTFTIDGTSSPTVAQLTGTVFAVSNSPTYVTTDPARILDTRAGTGAPKAPVGPKGTITLTVPNLPAGTTALVLNLTGTGLTGAPVTFVSACPAAQTLAACTVTSALNPVAAQDVANEVTVPVGSDGKITLYNNAGRIDLVADLVGYQTGGYVATGPARILDTRVGTGAPNVPVGPKHTITLTVPNLPAGTSAVVLNLTGTGLTGAPVSFVSACPAAQALSACTATSALNPVDGGETANEITVPVGSDGKITLYNNAGSIDLVADLVGYQTGDYTTTGPTRILDTRTGTGTPTNRLGAKHTMTLTVPNLPTGTTAVVLNLTGTGLTGALGSYVSACPAADTLTACTKTSALNAVLGVDVANEITVPVGPDGKITLYNNTGSIDLVADLAGYLTAG